MNDGQERALLRAEQARLVLSSDAYQEAWNALHKALTEALMAVEDGDDKGRYHLWQSVKIAETLNRALNDMIQTGEAVERALSKALEQKERMASRNIRIV